MKAVGGTYADAIPWSGPPRELENWDELRTAISWHSYSVSSINIPGFIDNIILHLNSIEVDSITTEIPETLTVYLAAGQILRGLPEFYIFEVSLNSYPYSESIRVFSDKVYIRYRVESVEEGRRVLHIEEIGELERWSDIRTIIDAEINSIRSEGRGDNLGIFSIDNIIRHLNALDS
ncbi:MAG: hypothetical protein FWC79_00250 [Oscillospiraceae bacterium]|nr:hypothetical protein [Oscillospiraceae bacterium]